MNRADIDNASKWGAKLIVAGIMKYIHDGEGDPVAYVQNFLASKGVPAIGHKAIAKYLRNKVSKELTAKVEARLKETGHVLNKNVDKVKEVAVDAYGAVEGAAYAGGEMLRDALGFPNLNKMVVEFHQGVDGELGESLLKWLC